MPKTRPHILLVDDELSIRDPLARYLEKQGYRVTEAGNAASARDALKGYDIDVVLLDIMMPGADGIRLTSYDPVFAAQMEVAEQIMREDRDLLRRLAE